MPLWWLLVAVPGLKTRGSIRCRARRHRRSGEAATGSKQITVVVGPIEIPEYLDRPQIVTRSGSHRLTLAEFDRWAEPVKQRFPRVLAENLAVLLATDRVVVAPWQSAASLDYRVAVDVIRFEGAPGGEVELVARWMVLGSEGDEIAPMKKSSLVVRANSPGYDGLAAAMSQAIADLSRHIAAAIRTAKCR